MAFIVFYFNYIYFEYSKRKKWFLVAKFNDKIIHDIYNYEQFNIDYNNKNLSNYNMENKKYQECYTRKILIDNFNIKSYNEIYQNLKMNLI